jgi:hypothetical protein
MLLHLIKSWNDEKGKQSEGLHTVSFLRTNTRVATFVIWWSFDLLAWNDLEGFVFFYAIIGVTSLEGLSFFYSASTDELVTAASK